MNAKRVSSAHAQSLSECPNCHERKEPHRTCPRCGYVRGNADADAENIQRQILALRRTRDIYAGYGDAAEADRLLDQIGLLEVQLEQSHKRGREAREQKQGE